MLNLWFILGCLWPLQDDFPLPAHVQQLEIPVYLQTETYQDPYQGRAALAMAYANYHIQNPEVLTDIQSEWVQQVDLVFTKYPIDTAAWRTSYTYLLQSRLKELHELMPGLFTQPKVKWRYVLQTEGKTEKEAKSYFHGLVLHWERGPSPILDTVLHHFPEMSPISDIIFGRVPKLPDSSAFWVFSRHPEWVNKVVIMDWTASMYQNRATVLNWHRKQLNQGGIKHLILFNDGNRTPHMAKRKGKTGGIYHIVPDTLELVVALMAKVKANGLGGDPAENDIEALLRATRGIKGTGEVILLPDRNSSIRDISLVRYLHHPVRIILFRGKKTRSVGLGSSGEWIENTWVHPHYLSLASLTKGSIHFHDREIYDLHKMKAGERIKFGSWEYEKKANGTFKSLRY